MIRTRSLRTKGGFITLEAAAGVALLLFVFVVLLNLFTTLLLQMQVEEEASELARKASLVARVPGTSVSQDLAGGNGSAEVVWGRDYVWVRVEAEDGRAAAERIFAREEP